MREHHFFKVDFINFPETKRAVKGVYLIGNYYIGASQNIRQRILQHCKTVYDITNQCYKQYVDYDCIRNRYIFFCISKKIPVKVYYLSNNPFDEGYFCRKYNICLNQHFYHKAYKKKHEQYIRIHNNTPPF
jgi:hypothetical protein